MWIINYSEHICQVKYIILYIHAHRLNNCYAPPPPTLPTTQSGLYIIHFVNIEYHFEKCTQN